MLIIYYKYIFTILFHIFAHGNPYYKDGTPLRMIGSFYLLVNLVCRLVVKCPVIFLYKRIK